QASVGRNRRIRQTFQLPHRFGGVRLRGAHCRREREAGGEQQNRCGCHARLWIVLMTRADHSRTSVLSWPVRVAVVYPSDAALLPKLRSASISSRTVLRKLSGL